MFALTNLELEFLFAFRDEDGLQRFVHFFQDEEFRFGVLEYGNATRPVEVLHQHHQTVNNGLPSDHLDDEKILNNGPRNKGAGLIAQKEDRVQLQSYRNQQVHGLGQRDTAVLEEKYDHQRDQQQKGYELRAADTVQSGDRYQ